MGLKSGKAQRNKDDEGGKRRIMFSGFKWIAKKAIKFHAKRCTGLRHFLFRKTAKKKHVWFVHHSHWWLAEVFPKLKITLPRRTW